MASSTETVSAEEFKDASEILDGLIGDFLAIHNFATRYNRPTLSENSVNKAALQEFLDRIDLGCFKLFPILERYKEHVERSLLVNEPRRSNCGHVASNYHGLVMKILDDFRIVVLQLIIFGKTGNEPFDQKLFEFKKKRLEQWLAKNPPMSPEEGAIAHDWWTPGRAPADSLDFFVPTVRPPQNHTLVILQSR